MKRGNFNFSLKKAQVTIFVIIALILVAGIAGYFIVKKGVFSTIPSSISPVYDYYLSCLSQGVKEGANIMATQGGYIYSPDFSPGSEYAPFSSQLAFMGFGIPYWYYVSANGVKREQVPNLVGMQKELAKYIQQEAFKKCDFSSFADEGYEIDLSNSSSTSVSISDNKIKLNVNSKLVIKKGEESYSISSYNLEVDSNLGKFYNLAKKIYDYEQKSMFLENYSVDVLYNYAPVEGVALNCSPVVWNPYDVINNLKNALNANIGAIKLNGEYYSLNNQKDRYFVTGSNAGFNLKTERVNFIYSQSWPSRFEVWPTKNNMMVASPIGTQQGLSMLGFCYAPYKFVYDMYFPVLIQLSDENAQEVFQFPMAIVIDKNSPREAITNEYFTQPADICDNANKEIIISTYTNNLEPVESEIQFKCLNSVCSLGKTKIDNSSSVASLIAKVPECYNGIVIANAKGYGEEKQIISTNEESSADIILQKEYTLPLEIYVKGAIVNDNSIFMISESSENSSNYVGTVSYPLKKEITLKEGNYDFDLKVYKSGNLVIPATTTKQCVKQPKAGIFGMIVGLEEEKCYDINIPSQTISNLIYAGGKLSQYITQSELSNAKVFRIYANAAKDPSNLEEVQQVYDSIENKRINIQLV